MSQKLRQDQILHILDKRKYVTVRYLVDALHYSSATINRDLNEMQARGTVKRSYGGVEICDGGALPPLPQRQSYMRREKRRNARAAARLIQNGDTLFLDGSTTVQHLTPFLLEKKDLQVITNNMHLAIELGEADVDVVCLGGRLCERPHVLGSEETVENAMRYHADKMFFSVGRITVDGQISVGNYLLYRAMMKNSKEVYLLTDHVKLMDWVEHAFCDFSALTGVISDFDFPEETKRAYPGVKFIVAEE